MSNKNIGKLVMISWVLGIVAIPLSVITLAKNHQVKKQNVELEQQVDDLKQQVRDWEICTLEVVECEYEK